VLTLHLPPRATTSLAEARLMAHLRTSDWQRELPLLLPLTVCGLYVQGSSNSEDGSLQSVHVTIRFRKRDADQDVSGTRNPWRRSSGQSTDTRTRPLWWVGSSSARFSTTRSQRPAKYLYLSPMYSQRSSTHEEPITQVAVQNRCALETEPNAFERYGLRPGRATSQISLSAQ